MSRRWIALPVLLLMCTLTPITPVGRAQTTAPAAAVTVSGSVVDAQLAPLAGVIVTLERDGRAVATATTAADGRFRFASIAPGTYHVRAVHTGFPAFVREVRVPADAAAVQLPIVLARADERLQQRQVGDASVQRGTVAPPPAAYPPAGGVATTGAGRGGRGGGAANRQLATDGLAPQIVQTRERLEEPWAGYRYAHSGERYARIEPNRFQSALHNPLSTFGADVDTASYTNIRRFLSQGRVPPPDAVRVEEFVNYFRFAYDEPRGRHPISITTEVADSPWAPGHKLVLVGARARAPIAREISGRNVVLLLDVSGSMAPAERLPLIKSALAMFVDTLSPDDRLAIVTYAGTSGVALPSTPIRHRDIVQRAIAQLSAGGSTNGGSGLITAYRVAREAFIPGGVNRVILASDGDFNVGIVNQRDLLQLIERERESGVFLSVLGVGSGNLKDATMEMLADRGNGHYAYLDSLQEARRVLVREADSTVETVAKDVKFQVEFNPAMVSAWKLIGYENRLLAAEDFNDDRKDGGEMGAGHTVTVLYEIVPVGVAVDDAGIGRPTIDPLRYQSATQAERPQPPPVVNAATAGEWLTVKTRYKAPEGETSTLITTPVKGGGAVRHLPAASAVAEFGLLLRAGHRDPERWADLERRITRLTLPGDAAGAESFRELVAIASSLLRR